jgi:3-hydroxyisobutyrate dehydrogenase-like beta-hydroxyacid dehydrogenase
MRIAFLGLGIMGSRMAANLVRAGHEVTVWNRTASTADAFVVEHSSARVAPTPRDAASAVEIVVTMVVDGPQVEQVLLGEEGAADGAQAGTLFIDCSTIGPAAARLIGDTLRTHSFGFLDAPVTGSSPRAEDGTLTFMVGGDRGEFDRAQPAFDAMGKVIIYAGELGQGQLVKVINNTVAAVNATTLGQALLAGAGAGADLDALVAVMAAGSGGSVMLDLKAGPMRRHDYSTLFKLDHMLKDVRLCLETVGSGGPGFEFGQRTEAILAAASKLGYGEQDFAALIEALQDEVGSSI